MIAARPCYWTIRVPVIVGCRLQRNSDVPGAPELKVAVVVQGPVH
jgi:hypothetical protein